MLLAGLFLAAFARSAASPLSTTVPGSTISSPICIVAATVTASQCDPTRTRTIFDILYSCISVILLCTYISVHHNIPDQDDSKARVMWTKVRTTLYALIAPEVVIMWAMRQRIMAGRIAEKNKYRRWTRTHGFFVQMGGLVQRQSDWRYKVLCSEEGIAQANIPRIPEKEIKDRGKGDILAKALVVVQTTWFVAQCIARHTQGLVLTEIELVTLAFATLNVITYGLWWDKPLNVEYPIYFDENGVRIDGPQVNTEMQVKERGPWYQRIWESIKAFVAEFRDVCLLVYRQPSILIVVVVMAFMAFMAIFGPLWDMMTHRDIDNNNTPTSVHPYYATKMQGNDEVLAILGGSVVGILFGAIHLIGWNFRFSTITELWLWRASSLVLVITPFILAIGSGLSLARERLHIEALEHSAMFFLLPTMFLGPPLYFTARIILLFLAFFAFRALPESAYQNVRWTEYLPHI
ncbi:hypothetical protein AX16_009424 [Volvariella volvacea WC 439]|nr:hypothetical protein AX16_009424 [Volvariella volvacea WC 439]